MSRKRQTLGPYSKTLRRGVIGQWIDGRSELGRYARDLEAQLIAHVGGSPTITQKLLIERVVKTALQLRAFDEKLSSGSWTELDARTHGGLVNRHRLMLRELGGLKGTGPEQPRAPSLADLFRAPEAAA